MQSIFSVCVLCMHSSKFIIDHWVCNIRDIITNNYILGKLFDAMIYHNVYHPKFL